MSAERWSGAPGTDGFTLSRWGARVSVDSDLPGLNGLIGGLLDPYFPITPGIEDGADATAVRVTVRRTDRLPVDPDDLAAVPRSPQLWLDEKGPRFVVLDHRPDRAVLLRDNEADSDPVLITATPPGRLRIDVTDDGPGTRRAVVRLLTFLLCGQLHAAGVPVLHGSAVARNGQAVLIAGPTNAGKSTLAFLAATLGGWDFVSDDSLLAWRDGPEGALRVSGMPRRMGISVGSLLTHPARAAFERHPLRRYDGTPIGALPSSPADAWSRETRVRLYCDVDEFAAVTGVALEQNATPVAVVLPTADPTVSGWRIEPAEDADPLELHPTEGRNLRHYVDYLHLLPPREADARARAEVLDGLRRLPRVRVRYGPDVNADFPRFWDEVTAALGLAAVPA
ncbi:hypothetical protein CFP65_3478 [Kitasatospora sp. MMS16-BH015]|uniref:hypothetical protein n=1 Tax=Kitasatospora sp. MMS16-BH015 TaxID=2018025 RepID=UPI000CA31AA4|nr:hypothetical protein [Kitasatospora sp. MMS16-BH015]AUG78271.1 hypothetical protein CFP65_3478 [Kitasatospora sp. MMS16-BH015]